MKGSRQPQGKPGAALQGLSAEIHSTDPSALREVVAILTRIEDAAEATTDAPLEALMNTMASGLCAVVLDEVPDGAAAMHAIGDAATMVEAPGDADALTEAERTLRAALEAEVQEIEDLELVSLDDIAARLVTYTPEDRSELRDLCRQLEMWAAQEGLADSLVQPLQAATAVIEQAILCDAEDPAKALESAGDLVAEAVDVAERFGSIIPENSDTAPAEPKPESEPATTTPHSGGQTILRADVDMEILKDYIVESLDHIEMAETSLLSLESDPDDTELVNTVFRAFHTIKGASGFFGLDRNQELAHLAENLLDRARSGELKLVGGYADLCLRSCDLLRAMVESVGRAYPDGALMLPAGLDDLLAQLADPAAAGITEADSVEPMRVGDILVGKGVADRDQVEAAAERPGPEPIGEKLVKQHVAPAREVAQALRMQKQLGGSAAEASARVATSRLDAMVNMVGELVIAQSMVAEDAGAHQSQMPRLARNVSHAGKIIRDLQDLTMSLRMVPLKSVFNKMTRLVRDLARQLGKSVQLITEGEDTEIDRNMVESLNDPLLHLIRNAVDHGIESAEARAERGKPATGAVRLRAYHSAGNVVIELHDDGRGLSRERIVARAVDESLIESGRGMSDSDVYSLIWHPGFSTAEKVTDVSGRGVGMDVVKRSIEKLRGRVEVSCEPGVGSTFTMRLPLTVAIADAMLVRVGRERFLVPTISIEQSFRPTPDELSSVAGRGEMVMLRGDLLEVFRLHRLFDVPDAVTEICEGLLVVIEGDGKRCAVLVDELMDQQQVVVKTLGETFGDVRGVAGAAILSDGDVGLILDAAGLILPAARRDVEPATALPVAV